jgi:large subunit ribosomal protein L1
MDVTTTKELDMAEAKKKAAVVKKAKPVAKTKITKPESKEIITKTPEVVEDTVSLKAEAEVKTKAGKRSAKALREAEELKAKEERKSQTVEVSSEDKPKKAIKPTRSRLERRGKKFRELAKKLEPGKQYTATQAVELATQTSPTKFDATVELHINLNVDPKKADQNIRDNIVLPAGTGKTLRVAVFSDDKIDGADISGTETIIKALEKGMINFDVLIATPASMPKLGKYARLLGPRGLMPNPKSGTVTTDIVKAVGESKAGRIEYRVDSTGIVHLGIGKVSFGKDKLMENFQAVAASIKGNKPGSVKDNYIKSLHITTSMGPSIAILTSDF